MHTLPEQQPAQLSGPHHPPAGSQVPVRVSHVSRRPQLEQNSPPIPHAVVSVPDRQLPEMSQQPLQLSGPHEVLPVQNPLLHDCPAPHDVH